jgi:hypothetical protein
MEGDVVRDHRHRNRGAETIGLCDRPSRQVAAVGQARDAEAVGIGDAERDARVDAGHHVLEVHPARIADHRLREHAVGEMSVPEQTAPTVGDPLVRRRAIRPADAVRRPTDRIGLSRNQQAISVPIIMRSM